MSEVLQILITIVSSTAKFAMTFPLAVLQFDFSFVETLLWTNLGGIFGIYFFAFLSEKILAWWRNTFLRKRTRKRIESREKKRFTKRNRRIVTIKQRYGLVGIAATTPLLLSIPIGAFLVTRYYRRNPYKMGLLIASNLVWSVIYTAFYSFWDGLLLTKL